jgi:hypothetical protein
MGSVICENQNIVVTLDDLDINVNPKVIEQTTAALDTFRPFISHHDNRTSTFQFSLTYAYKAYENLKTYGLPALAEGINEIIKNNQPYLEFEIYNQHFLRIKLADPLNPNNIDNTELCRRIKYEASEDKIDVQFGNEIDLNDRKNDWHDREKIESFIKKLVYRYKEDDLFSALDTVYRFSHVLRI